MKIVKNPPKKYLNELQRSLEAERMVGIVDIWDESFQSKPIYYAAMDNDKAIGVATLRPGSGTFIELYKLYVSPTHRKHGIAVELLTHVIAILKSEGKTELHIQVTEQSFSFWQRVGIIWKIEPWFDDKYIISLT